MPRIPGLRRIFRLDGPARNVERDVDDELDFHFAEKVRELEAAGHTPERARALAEHRFGDVTRYRDELATIDGAHRRAARRADLLGAAWHDLRHAARGLRRQPGFALAVVLTFALGIGANATMFGIVDRLVLQPPPHVGQADRLHRVLLHIPFAGDTIVSDGLSYPLLQDLRAGVPAFDGVVAEAGGTMSLGRGAEAQPVSTARVTGDFFGQLRVRPALGRLLGPADDVAGMPIVAVLSHGFWQRQFGGDPNVVGTVLPLDRAHVTVVGVAPAGFRGLDRDAPDVWMPLVPTTVARGESEALTMYGWQWLALTGRLRDGATPALATAQLDVALRGVAERDRHVSRETTGELRSVLPRASLDRNADARVALLLGGVSVLVLLIACANVANLLLARALRRRRETAVRLALGVSRRRLALQWMAESLLLAAVGGAAALLVVRWGGGVIAPLLLGEVGAGTTSGRVLAFTALATTIAGVLAGLVPAVQASRPALTGALRQDSRGGTRGGRTRAVLLVGQAALSVVLLVGTGLFVRSLQRVAAEPLGLDVSRVLVGRVNMESAGYDAARAHALDATIAERVRRLPGVASTALAVSLPLSSSFSDRFTIPGRDSLPRVADGGPYFNAVSAEYFRTVGTRVVRGRGLTADDSRPGAARAMVINEAMARLYWPGEDPIGACVRVGDETLPCTTVVGIVTDARRQNIVESVSLQYFVPLEHDPMGSVRRVLLVRAADGVEPATLAPLVRQTMQGAAPDLPYARVHPMAELLEDEMRPWRLGATLFTAFGALALLLAAVGLYGVISYAVSQRTHEMGVRLALGARSATLLGMVVREGVVLAAAGVAAGLALALLGAPLVSDLLFQTSPRDPLVLGGVALTLLAVSIAACLAPAWRASRVEPSVALRSE